MNSEQSCPTEIEGSHTTSSVRTHSGQGGMLCVAASVVAIVGGAISAGVGIVAAVRSEQGHASNVRRVKKNNARNSGAIQKIEVQLQKFKEKNEQLVTFLAKERAHNFILWAHKAAKEWLRCAQESFRNFEKDERDKDVKKYISALYKPLLSSSEGALKDTESLMTTCKIDFVPWGKLSGPY